MISGPKSGPGIVTTAHADYTTTAGNTRTNVHINESVMRTGDGRKVTKTVTEQRVTRMGDSTSPAPGQRRISLGSMEHTSRSASRSPLIWQPPSHTAGDTGSQTSTHSTLMWRPQSQASVDMGSRSANRSPVMWQGQPNKLNTQHLQKSQSLLDVHFGHKGRTSPTSRSLSPAAPKHQRSGSTPSVKKVRANLKENINPIMVAEQAKWEKIHENDNGPKYNFGAYETSKLGGKSYAPPKMDDPNYPMFEVPKLEWSPPKLRQSTSLSPKRWGPPVAPKPLLPSPTIFASNELAGVDKHYPGMNRPPPQELVKPAPMPPPMPPLPLECNTSFNVVSIDTLRRPVSSYDGSSTGRPDHLPVFAPRVMISPNDDSSMLMSPDCHDACSDILALHKSKLPFFCYKRM